MSKLKAHYTDAFGNLAGSWEQNMSKQPPKQQEMPFLQTFQTPFKVIIAGSRDIKINIKKVFPRLDKITSKKSSIEIVSGTARGGDRLGEAWARTNGHEVKKFPADWGKYGRSAGYKRNEQMADYADALIAIWDGKSKGTKHMIDIATKKGLPVRIIQA